MAKKIELDPPVLIIGLGRFGAAAAGQLQRLNRDVLAIDTDEQLVQKWSERITHTAQADARSLEALRQLGANEFQVAIVAVGTSVEASVLITANLSELGIPQIWAKAMSRAHGKILSKIGAHHVIYPEAEAGERIAHLVNGRMLEFVEFDDEYALAKMFPPAAFRGMTIAEANIRKKFGVNIVGIKTPGEKYIDPTSSSVIPDYATIIVSGRSSDIERFAKQ